MSSYQYTCNAWGYVRAEQTFTAAQIAGRICGLGFDGFDFMIGPDSTPFFALEQKEAEYRAVREAAEKAGGRIGAIVFVGFPLQDPDVCRAQFEAAPRLAEWLETKMINLLPRKNGIPFEEGWKRFETVWREKGEVLGDAGLTVSAENHVFPVAPDDDIFLIRRSGDFDRMLEMSKGQLKVKFDPSWLMKNGANEDPLPVFDRLLPHVSILDLKDIRDDVFVTPGTGVMNFEALKERAVRAGIRNIAVEVEEHHFMNPEPRDPAAIDQLNKNSLTFYQKVFGS